MTRSRIALGLLLVLAVSIGLAAAGVSAQTKPEGEIRFAFYVTISPSWFDPGDVTGFITPFWTLWAMHDALVKTMPGKAMAPSLEALLHQIQQTLAERVRFGMIYEYVWPSGVGPKVAEPALLLIDPYPWAAPYEELRLR